MFVLKIAAGAALIAALFFGGLSALPGEASRSASLQHKWNALRSWYYDDRSWEGTWSTHLDSATAMLPLNAQDVFLQLTLAQGVATGIIASPTLCARFPFSDMVQFHGEIIDGQLHGTAYPMVGGEPQGVVTIVVTRDGNNMQFVASADEVPLFSAPISIRKHVDLSAPRAPAQLQGYCDNQREALIRRLRPPAKAALPSK